MSHYETMGVAPNASPEEIKAAFRRLARENHPDREGGNADVMTAVNQAYAILSDPEKRARYDETGEDGPTKSREQAVRDYLMGVLVQILEADGNIIAIARERIHEERGQLGKVRAQQQRRKEKLTKKRATVATKGDAPNLVHMLIDQQLRGIEMMLPDIEDKLNLSAEALEVLETHTCSTIVMDAAPRSYGIEELLRMEANAHRTGNPFYNRFEGP